MKHFLVLLLLAGLISACSQTDGEKIRGKWRFSKMVANRDLIVSDDPTEQQQIIDNAVYGMRDQLTNMNETEDAYAKKLRHDMELMLKVTFDFTADSTVVVSSNSPKNASQSVWRYRLESEKKQLVIYEPTRTVIYTYALRDNLLTLSDDKDSIVFKKH